MTSHDLTFGVFIPQGWKMELRPSRSRRPSGRRPSRSPRPSSLGYDSLWVYDHFHNVPVPAHETVLECWTIMAAMSQRTSRVRLGQLVGCTPTGTRRCWRRSPPPST